VALDIAPGVSPRLEPSGHGGGRNGEEEPEMRFRAVVFDIGGVLEFTPPLGMAEKWADQLGLAPGELP
jgi:hypothetical protein